MKRFLLTILLWALWGVSPSFAQQLTRICQDTTTITGVLNCIPVNSTNPLNITGSFTATTTGFGGIVFGTPISVTTGGVTGTLPTNTGSVVATNVGATNGAYCAIGASATTSSQYIAPNGGWFAFNQLTGANTQLTCITSTSTTTVNMSGGSGLATGTGGGGGGSGGAITAASGSYASGSIASGAMIDLGAQADTVCSTDIGTCSLIALVKRTNQNIDAPLVAGEAHVGEIGSNQIKVQVAQTVTASSAYTSGNAIGGLMTVAGAARVSGSLGASGTGGILSGLAMNAKSLQTTQVDVFLFDANPTGSTCTDKTAFSLVTADFDKVVGILTIPGTAANGAGWFGGGTGSVGIPSYFPVTYDLSSATSIYACAVTRGTPTYTATTDVSFKFNFLRN